MLGVFLVCLFAILVKDSSLLVYYLSEGFKACWESSWPAGLLSW